MGRDTDLDTLGNTLTAPQRRILDAAASYSRVCIITCNGIGKTYALAELAVNHARRGATVLLTAPTRRQVRDQLIPECHRRLCKLALVAAEAEPRLNYELPSGGAIHALATNAVTRLQGYHAPTLTAIVDEASGFPPALLWALEGCAVGENDRIILSGNPNNTTGALWVAHNLESYRSVRIPCWDHPNIATRSTVVPGATSWPQLQARLRDWCTPLPPGAPPRPPGDFELDGTWYHPNDQFRVRYLALEPATPAGCLFSPDALADAVHNPPPLVQPPLAALDVARTGGDATIYALRYGSYVPALELIPPAPLTEQASLVAALLRRDRPAAIIVDAAGLGIGLIDALRPWAPCPVREFRGSDTPLSPAAAARFRNLRAQAYGNLAAAVAAGDITLPPDDDLAAELTSITFAHDDQNRLTIAPKRDIAELLGHSPDRADAASMLWLDPPATPPPTRRRRRPERTPPPW